MPHIENALEIILFLLSEPGNTGSNRKQKSIICNMIITLCHILEPKIYSFRGISYIYNFNSINIKLSLSQKVICIYNYPY